MPKELHTTQMMIYSEDALATKKKNTKDIEQAYDSVCLKRKAHEGEGIWRQLR